MPDKALKEPMSFPALRPRRGMFYLFMGLFILWLLILAVMFVTTVYPHPETDPHRRAGAARGTSLPSADR